MRMTDPPKYKDLSRLALALEISLGVYAVLVVIALWLRMIDIANVLGYVDGAVTNAEIMATSAQLGIVSTISGPVFGLVAVLFLRWTYLSNINARALGADLPISPAWS